VATVVAPGEAAGGTAAQPARRAAAIEQEMAARGVSVKVGLMVSTEVRSAVNAKQAKRER
jgi:hypothetical protein